MVSHPFFYWRKGGQNAFSRRSPEGRKNREVLGQLKICLQIFLRCAYDGVQLPDLGLVE